MLEQHNYVYKKEVDWSVLQQGISIPVTIQVIFQNTVNRFIPRGQSKDIFLVLEGKTYKANLVNQRFDERKYPNRKDILQIRYNPQSDIAEKLRSIFEVSYRYIIEHRNSANGNQRIFTKIPEEQKEHLAIYTTEYDDTYYLECITLEDKRVIKQTFMQEDEQEYEASINYISVDSTATIASVSQIVKERRLNRAIGENLKLLYNYQCQICGENVGDRYGVHVVEAHHIDPFVESLNNDANNQLIICPNHHRIVHRAAPEFERKKLIFIYNNGIEERLLLNRHL
ncbi:MAG: HNH endonuclease [Bacillota bacterium]|nr:HNH endonuclease [Bacillota bacterium]